VGGEGVRCTQNGAIRLVEPFPPPDTMESLHLFEIRRSVLWQPWNRRRPAPRRARRPCTRTSSTARGCKLAREPALGQKMAEHGAPTSRVFVNWRAGRATRPQPKIFMRSAPFLLALRALSSTIPGGWEPTRLSHQSFIESVPFTYTVIATACDHVTPGFVPVPPECTWETPPVMSVTLNAVGPPQLIPIIVRV
jgi:hypothetical protein